MKIGNSEYGAIVALQRAGRRTWEVRFSTFPNTPAQWQAWDRFGGID
ncbi:MAG: hypothetical protein ABI901_06655 [Roseiflexaceae bacterium]